MKSAELSGLKKEEIILKINDAEKDLAELKFKHSLNQLENPMLIRGLRKDIARMKSAL